MTLACCWRHGRRDVFEIHRSTGSPIAAEVLRRIAGLYRLDDAIRGQPPDERRHRVVATVRRNSLFAGSDAGARSWAIFTSLIQTARLNDVDPVAWLTDVLERMASGAVKANDLDRLPPWTWKTERVANATATA